MGISTLADWLIITLYLRIRLAQLVGQQLARWDRPDVVGIVHINGRHVGLAGQRNEEAHAVKGLENLVNDSLLPALIFRTARKQCDADIERLAKSRSALLSKDAQENLVREVEAVAQRYSIDLAVLTENPQYHALVSTACGAHHAGQLLAHGIAEHFNGKSCIGV